MGTSKDILNIRASIRRMFPFFLNKNLQQHVMIENEFTQFINT